MRHNYNLTIFENKNDIFYYLLGVLLTDGNIFTSTKYNKIQLTSKDFDWIEILQSLLNCPAYPTKDGHKNLTINSKNICQILINSGCLPNKSLIVKIPSIPNKYITDFIRGCMDGDGSIPRGKNKQCYLASSSLDFLKSINEIIITQKINSHIYEIDKTDYTLKNGKIISPKHPHYRLVMTGNSAKQFLAWIYYPEHKLSMPRKKLLAHNF
jgi:intein/homing endonuclease